MKKALIATAMAFAIIPSAALAQQAETIALAPGATRLDLSVTGSTSRVPDVAIISAGVQTRAATAGEALAENAARMDRVLKALKKAGIAERDIRTSSIDLNPQYDYRNGEEPRLVGYNAGNQVSVKFRDIEKAGSILDILVAEGANQINGPSLTLDDPSGAMDEARLDAIKQGQQRAELYARAMGKKVARLVMVSEVSMPIVRPIMALEMSDRAAAAPPATKIVPGEQDVSVTIQMSFDLQ